MGCRRNMGVKSYSDGTSGCRFIMQTSQFSFIRAAAVILDQGQGNVSQYIFPDLYSLCPKYLRSNTNGFMWGANVVAAAAADAETN